MNLETPQQQDPNVTQIPVQYTGQEFPPQEQPQQFSQGNSDGHQEVPLKEGSEHEQAVSDDAGMAADMSPEHPAETYETTQPEAPESSAEEPVNIDETPDAEPSGVDDGRWGHDKAESLAYALAATEAKNGTGAGKDIIDSSLVNHKKSKEILEMSPDEYLSAYSMDHVRQKAIKTELERLLAEPDLDNWSRSSYEKQLEDVQTELADREAEAGERARQRADELRRRASEEADRKLEFIERVYELNPDRAKSLSGKELVELSERAFTRREAYHSATRKKGELEGTFSELQHMLDQEDAYDLVINAASNDRYLRILQTLFDDQFEGEDSERTAGLQKIEQDFKAATNFNKVSGLVAVENYRSMLEPFKTIIDHTLEEAAAEYGKVIDEIKTPTN